MVTKLEMTSYLFCAVVAIVAPHGERKSDTKTTDCRQRISNYYLMWRHPTDSCELPDLVS